MQIRREDIGGPSPGERWFVRQKRMGSLHHNDLLEKKGQRKLPLLGVRGEGGGKSRSSSLKGLKVLLSIVFPTW